MLYLHVYLRKGFRLMRSNGQVVVAASTRRYAKEVFIDRLVERIAQHAPQLGVFTDITPDDVAVVYYDAAPSRGAAMAGLTVELAIPATMVDPSLGTAEAAIVTTLTDIMAEVLQPETIVLPKSDDLSVRVYADFTER